MMQWVGFSTKIQITDASHSKPWRGVCQAFRALSLKELHQHALAVEAGDTVLDEDLVSEGQQITSLCAGLVVVDQRTNVVIGTPQH